MSVKMADTRDMYVVHTVFRREFGLMPALVRGVADGDVARAELVGEHVQLLCDLLHEHHEAEDEVIWPRLLERGAEDVAPIVQTMEDQHNELEKVNQEIVVILPIWRDTAGQQYRAELAEALDALCPLLREHTAMEEGHVLPLAERYLTATEWQQVGQRAMDGLPKKRLPLLFGMGMYEGDPEVVKGILAGIPLVPRLLLPAVAPRQFAAHSRRIHGTATPPRAARD